MIEIAFAFHSVARQPYLRYVVKMTVPSTHNV